MYVDIFYICDKFSNLFNMNNEKNSIIKRNQYI